MSLHNLFHNQILLVGGEAVKQTEKALQHLKIDEENQMLAFQGHLDEIFLSQIFVKGRFEFLKRRFFPFHHSKKGRFHYDMILPFYTKKQTKGCVDNANLPPFYTRTKVKQ